MTNRHLRIAILLIGSMVYWRLVCRVAGVNEPWDADSYWRLWYPVAILLSAAAGWSFGRQGWLAGVIVTFAQVPVMAWNGGIGALWAVGLLTLCVSALPLVVVSALSGRLAARWMA